MKKCVKHPQSAAGTGERTERSQTSQASFGPL